MYKFVVAKPMWNHMSGLAQVLQDIHRYFQTKCLLFFLLWEISIVFVQMISIPCSWVDELWAKNRISKFDFSALFETRFHFWTFCKWGRTNITNSGSKQSAIWLNLLQTFTEKIERRSLLQNHWKLDSADTKLDSVIIERNDYFCASQIILSKHK